MPPHLVTREFFSEVRERLTPEGIFVMNLIGAAQGDHSPLFWRVMNGVRAAFPHTQLYGTNARNPASSQNLMIVASSTPLDPRIQAWKAADRAPNPRLNQLLQTQIDTVAAPDSLLFTDDYNPVEITVARQLRVR